MVSPCEEETTTNTHRRHSIVTFKDQSFDLVNTDGTFSFVFKMPP